MGTRTSAHQLVAKKFAAMGGPSPYWPTIDHDKIRDEIDFRIDSPDLIWQSQASLCGMATFFNAVAWDDPYLYAFYVVEMYRCGAAYLGHAASNPPLVKPSKTTRSSKRPTGMPSADWVALASLRDHLNQTLAYSYDMGIPLLKEIPLLGFLGNPSLVEKVGGITYPDDMTNILKAVGYGKVVNKAYKSTHPGLTAVDEASSYYKKGYRVLVLVNTDIFRDEATPSSIADHWVRLVAPIEKNGARLRARIYNPQTGDHETVPSSGGFLGKEQFAGNFFGFVAAKQ